MSNFKFVLNKAGVRELLNSSEMQEIISAHGQRVSASAGDGFEMEIKPTSQRTRAIIHASTPKAYYSNMKHNTLLKALKG